MATKTMHACCICIALVLTTACSAQSQEVPAELNTEPLRTWSSVSGKFQTEAVMTGYAAGVVHLRKTDGEEIDVPLDKLSTEDKKYVRQELKRRSNERRSQRTTRPDASDTTQTSATTDWPGWLGPYRDGKSPDGFEMQGTFNVEGEGTSWAHPVVIGGRLYLRYDTHLYCFDVRA